MLNGGRVLSAEETARLRALSGAARQDLIERIARDLRERERLRSCGHETAARLREARRQ